jgi:chaperonin GroEL
MLDGAIAVKAPSGPQRTQILEDIAVITGGRCVCQDRHERLADVRIDDLGTARQAWATKVAFGILGGQGSKVGIRQRIAEARAELSTIEGDPYTSDKIKERIGKLAGTAALIRRRRQQERAGGPEAARGGGAVGAVGAVRRSGARRRRRAGGLYPALVARGNWRRGVGVSS